MSDLTERLARGLDERYRLLREVGSGGMATVWLAEDTRHGRQVALKVLHPELSATLGSERFLNEIQLTAALQHPHILPLFDSGVADGLLYYVMPFVEGETLRDRLARERQLPVPDALRIAGEIADALDFAHRKGVIHRDIKPENVLLQDGRAVVADFGIALAVQQAAGARMTQTGLSLGTPQYMAPEQATGEKLIDARADVYALGVVTYEMLAGDPPFTGPNAQSIVARVLTAAPTPLREARPSVPVAAARAIHTALEKLPADRHTSAAAFRAALQGVEGVAHDAPPPARAGWGRLAAIGAAGVVLGAGAVALWRTPGTPAAPAAVVRFVDAPPDSLELRAVCCGQMFAISPDGRHLVYQARDTTSDTTSSALRYELYARDVSSSAVRRLPGTEGATSLSFSPDGRTLAFVTNQRLFRVPLQGDGAAQGIASLPNGFVGGSTWTAPDRVVVAVGTVLHEVNVTSGEVRTLLDADTTGRQPTGPWWVEGHGLLFTKGKIDNTPDVYWLPRGEAQPRRLMPGATPTYVPAWRMLLVVRLGTLLAFPFDPATGDTTGPARQVDAGVALRSPLLAHAEYAVSSTGALVIARRRGELAAQQRSLMILVGRRTDTLTLPIGEPHVVGTAQFSPDGRRLAFDVYTQGATRRELLFVHDVERGVTQDVTPEGGGRLPGWTAGSDTLVFLARDSIAVRAADGSGVARILGAGTGWSQVRRASTRRPWFVVSGERDPRANSSDLGFMHLDSAGRVTPYLTTAAEEVEPALSPDGKWLAYSSQESGQAQVFVSPFPSPTARYRVSVSGSGGGSTRARLPVWSGDGRTLYYSGAEQQFLAVSFRADPSPTFGEPRVVYRRPSVRDWTVSPDGSHMVFIDSAPLYTLVGLEVILNLDPRQ